MHLGELNPTERKKSRRVGRGNGSGVGKTCGRGTKGQGARSGGGVAPYFEGGQMPLYRRLPIRGFNNARFTRRYQIVKLSDIAKLSTGDPLTVERLFELGITDDQKGRVKILGDQDISQAYEIHAHHFSKSAVAKIEAAGGKAVRVQSGNKGSACS